jgi:hypothetical protein
MFVEYRGKAEASVKEGLFSTQLIVVCLFLIALPACQHRSKAIAST